MVVHTCNPSTGEAETGGSQVRGQPQQFSEALSNLVRPCFQIGNKIGLEPACVLPCPAKGSVLSSSISNAF